MTKEEAFSLKKGDKIVFADNPLNRGETDKDGLPHNYKIGQTIRVGFISQGIGTLHISSPDTGSWSFYIERFESPHTFQKTISKNYTI